MAKRTISAYVNEQVAELFDTAVATDQKRAAQVAARALDLYVLLEPEVRRGLAFIRDHGTEADQRTLLTAIARAVIHVQFTIARRSLVEVARLAGQAGRDVGVRGQDVADEDVADVRLGRGGPGVLPTDEDGIDLWLAGRAGARRERPLTDPPPARSVPASGPATFGIDEEPGQRQAAVVGRADTSDAFTGVGSGEPGPESPTPAAGTPVEGTPAAGAATRDSDRLHRPDSGDSGSRGA